MQKGVLWNLLLTLSNAGGMRNCDDAYSVVHPALPGIYLGVFYEALYTSLKMKIQTARDSSSRQNAAGLI